MARLFGTDGVRGVANSEVTPELALSVAAAAARVLGSTDTDRRPLAVVGRDPRASGEMLEAAVVAGLTSAGADVVRVGVLPTPAVAFLTGVHEADLGVMLSASHNPMPDNGIKIFARGGHKLPDEVEDDIEAMLRPGTQSGWLRPIGADVGRVSDDPTGAEQYVAHLVRSTPRRLGGLKVVVDCANGAASYVAPEAYRRMGADVVVIAAEPDGLNINDGVGSTHIEPLQKAVVETGADLGFAHDGDADRCLAVDASGQVVDGDQILAICAIALKAADKLRGDTVVATVMSNLGFHHAMRDAGITVATTGVGDRYVLERLRHEQLSVGGEQSGHVIFTEYATTGDGVLTALQVMARIAETGRGLADLGGVVVRLPQILKNVRVANKDAVATTRSVVEAVTAAERELGDEGRILLRPSGTEQLIRVMVEAPTQEQAESITERLAAVVAST